ncbi:lytic transglycosylase domain-containing protein [Salmonella enterica subsp. enterica serovar 4,[5],12:b:-]|nr:lytic transglycosylase domain-containing protein [Salmonella enterica subsp. enterica serovar 4,[5],12:b:-]
MQPAYSATTGRFDACFAQAGQRYLIDPKLLKSIAIVESSLIPDRISHNRGKAGKILSTDYGLMQINSSHIPRLKKLGVIKDKSELIDKPCLNIQIGAWILATHFQKCGINWSCLGSYNAGFKESKEQKRIEYARYVYNRYMLR